MKRLLIMSALCWLAIPTAGAQSVVRLDNLAGPWKFEAGDNMMWAKKDFSDRDWESLHVPGAWEEQGYAGYDGYAWYRKHFRTPDGIEGKIVLLKLGQIDDADETFINGTFIGFCGEMPPRYVTEYNTQREYQIPTWLLAPPGGDNVVAVRVYDDGGNGGITGGEIGLYVDNSQPQPDVSWDGAWKFSLGDQPSWSVASFDDHDWEQLYVPEYWETQGHKRYDGIAWYRFHFHLPARLTGQRLLVLVGRVDDYDETFLNGTRIGRTGSIPADGKPTNNGNEYSELRAYTVPMGLLDDSGENVLAVRVYDSRIHGGIYRGPVGLITREHFNKWRTEKRNTNPVFEQLRDLFFR